MRARAACFLSGWLVLVLAWAADPVVSNVIVAQRPGTKLVDIRYDLTADTPVEISVSFSEDDGTTWAVPATSLSGAVGAGTTAGTGRAIVWNGGAAWNGQHTALGRVRVAATWASTITFDLGTYGTRTGGGALAQQVVHGAAAVAPTFTVAAGWTFTGWSAPFSNVTSNLTVNAQYAPVMYTITFDLGTYGTRTGGGALAQQVVHGAAAVAPTFTVAAGWTFTGWSAPFSNVTSGLAVTAQYGGLYLVLDLAGGPLASSYPVSGLAGVPAGGWTAAYKTTRLVLRRIPKTSPSFTMGSPAGELGRFSDETQHTVTLTQDFYIGVFEITQKQWERVMGNWPSYFSNTSVRDARPVEQVSYGDVRGSSSGAEWPASSAVDATSFIGKLRQKTGLVTIDLPTESQWEYACRAGTTTALNNDANLTSTGQDANMTLVGRYYYNGGSAYTQSSGLANGPAAVGTYLANAWGLHDMHGNVHEFCLDRYGTYPGTVTDPPGAASGSYRVVRGGNWGGNADDCRAAARTWGAPGYRGRGFRLCSTVPAQ